MQNKDKGDGIEDSPLDMLLVILLEGASKEVVMPSSGSDEHLPSDVNRFGSILGFLCSGLLFINGKGVLIMD